MRGATLARTSAAVIAAGGIGALAGPDSTWYRLARKPSFQPPGVVFPIVWTALYAKIAWASARTIDRLDDAGLPAQARSFERALGANLALNTAWTWIFFRGHRPGPATLECAVLAASSIDLARRAATVDGPAAAGLAVYAGWTGFATVLSGRFWSLNRS
jgi:benzodiazapine receptor